MQKIYLLVALAIQSVLAVDKDEGVLVLTDDNFDEELKNHKYLLVEFYAPWCGHCKKLAPEYAGAAEVLAAQDPPLFVAKVDATENKKLAERFEVKGFPTLHWFVDGQKFDYTGGRSKDTIVSWINKKTGPPSAAVTCDELAKKAEENKFVISYFGSETDKLYTDVHVPYAQGEDKVVFVHTTDADCASKHGVTAPGLALFRKFEENVVPFTGTAASKDDIIAWVKPLMVPTVFEFTQDEIEAVFGQQQPTLFMFRAAADKDAAFMTTFSEAASAHKGKMLFAYADVSGGIAEKLGEFMGVQKTDLPVLTAILPASMKKHRSPTAAADLTVANIGQFADDVLAGKAEEFLKSEGIPEKNDGPVTVIVGKEWERIVADPTKDVLVKYYAPWCGHCKKLAPVWEELGEFYKDNENLVIAKFDATVNEVAGLQIQGYPTLMWYPKDDKSGKKYEGGRDLEGFKKFLSENSSVLTTAQGEL